MEKEYKVSEDQKVIIQNLTTIVANANQACALYLSKLANTEWEYLEEAVTNLQFGIAKLNDNTITVIEPKQDRTKKNK